jgi:hypothetical protein
MTQDFIPYELALEMKQLGFDEPCIGKWLSNLQSNWKEYTLVLEMGEVNRNAYLLEGACSAPLYQQAFRWFREKYDLHVQIRKENYVYRKVHCNYFHFDISKGEQNDITKQEDLHSNIMDECEQDIPGNYLDNEKFNILIFEKGFAFKTYEEVEIECLEKLIEICSKLK